MPTPTEPADTVELTFDDGRHIHVNPAIADRVRGVDADGDLLIPLGESHSPIHHDDGTEYLIPLTPCCHATGKGSSMAESVVCRRCYHQVGDKYGGPGHLAVRVATT